MKTKQLGFVSRPKLVSQRGVGLVEVLVAMLLLAIGVLGYAALQVRAVQATGEALNRSQAMVLLRGLAENIRVNSSVQSSYTAAVHGYAGITSGTTAPTTCVAASATDTSACTAAQLVAYDAFQTASTALGLGIKIDMYDCPGVNQTPKRQCMVAAWGKTNPVFSATSTPAATDCMGSDGVYNPAATCLMMEAY